MKLAIADFIREKAVDDNPERNVKNEKKCDVDVGTQNVIKCGQDDGGEDYRRHCCALSHAKGEEFVMNVVLVG